MSSAAVGRLLTPPHCAASSGGATATGRGDGTATRTNDSARGSTTRTDVRTTAAIGRPRASAPGRQLLYTTQSDRRAHPRTQRASAASAGGRSRHPSQLLVPRVSLR
ncbi:hypothetical protein MRX96_020854 [Rhipicephalus microplus]